MSASSAAVVDPVTIMSMKGAHEAFKKDGFVVVENIIPVDLCDKLNARLEAVLRGGYDKEGGKPDKTPKFSHDARVKKGKVPDPRFTLNCCAQNMCILDCKCDAVGGATSAWGAIEENSSSHQYLEGRRG